MKFTPEQIKLLQEAQKDKSLSAYHKRIQAVYFRSQGITYKNITNLIGLSHDTIWRLVKKFEKEGLSAFTQETRGGRNNSYMTMEEEQAFLKEYFSNSLIGEYVTIDALFKVYQERVGRPTTREGFYALLKRHGWRKVTPRPEHPKKADAKTILASKNKIYI
ncbi:TPA: winged helix-turn-helix domain-containing protein [Streptococcus suis]|nr:winged helix-turn-helix domain-containing protein [Streptococcus suis]